MANDGKTKSKPERIWNDPPILGEDTPVVRAEQLTLGANAPPEIKRLIVMLDRSHRIHRLISTVATAIMFTLAYAVFTLVPAVAPTDIMQFFIVATIVTTIAEVAHYYKIF